MTQTESQSVPKQPFLHLGHPDDHIPMFETPQEPSKKAPKSLLAVAFGIAIVVALIGWWLEHVGEGAVIPKVSLIWVVPFGLLLACIAIMPFIAKHFWEKYYSAVAVGLGLIVATYYLFVVNAGSDMAGHFGEYISFIFLLGSLFTVSGGILIRIRRTPTPLRNTGILLVGAILANVFGTTGAAVLLIRPFLRVNKGHIRPYHIVFFIFAVANVGGSLTPIGDPPLFLGYLKGVPFWWVFEHCWEAWCVAVGVILIMFLAIDTWAHRKDPRPRHEEHDFGPAVSLFGAINILFIGIVLVGVFLPRPWREMMMAAGAFGSLWWTPHRIHVENTFNFAPIKEVAILFVGIFATMVPALDYLSNNADSPGLREYLNTPGQYYYTTGALSSVLDNAPTYLVYLESELAKLPQPMVQKAKNIASDPAKVRPTDQDLEGMTPDDQRDLVAIFDTLHRYRKKDLQNATLRDEDVEVAMLVAQPKLNAYLVAISLGAVFFGACTYIGNGPNFMVKSIAEHAGVKCPSFFGYIFGYALPILLPTLILIWAIFLR